MRRMETTGRNRTQSYRIALIILACAMLVVLTTWFVPALSWASLNILFRLRGDFPPPPDIVIVAIDDRSLQEIGPWPWPRSAMAEAVNKLIPSQPRAIGLDIIYAEPTVSDHDQQLSAAIARGAGVVLPAQLYETASGAVGWLRPLPRFAEVAGGLGHVHVSPEVDGMVRSIQLSKADDQGNRIWAFGLEVIRLADGIPKTDIEELPSTLRFGPYRIPVRDETAPATIPGVTFLRQNEMMINFAGAAGTFRTYSMADLLAGRLPPSTFERKIVLIGATAQSMGDSRVAPFMHYGGGRGQGGQEMPGVEIHANIVNTIRAGISVRLVSDWAAFLLALLVMICSAAAIRWLDGWRQIATLGLILAIILIGGFLTFSRYLILPPLVPMLTGFAVVIPMLLNRSLAASRELDIKLAALAASQKGFLTEPEEKGAQVIDDRMRLDLPHGLAWKLRAVDNLTVRLLARMSFVNRVLTSMDEGVLVTDLQGRIVFSNRIAEQLLGAEDRSLIGLSFASYLSERSTIRTEALAEAMTAACDRRGSQIECELAPRHYSLALSALVADAETVGGEPSLPDETIGIVILISDITKRVELDRMKTETLQLVSHELRTPLTSIHGLSDVLLKFPVPPDEAREMLAAIHSEAVRLGETINRYLDLTRLESGARQLNLTSVDCRRLIQDCLRNLSHFANDRGIRLTDRVAPDLPELVADSHLLTQAIENLLGNAIKYSPPNTEVSVTASRRESAIIVKVIDQGYGIPEEARDRIFEKFYRLDRDATSGIVGTGLGLPLVKEIVELHGGKITFESSPGAGTTFTLTLPLKRFESQRPQRD